MSTLAFTLLVIFSASIHIWGEYRGPRQLVYIFKPLTMVFILLIAILGQGTSPFYRSMIIVGLLFSLAGDIFLMLPRDRFIAGLAAFLVAHLFYITAFVQEIGPPGWWRLIPFLLFGAIMYIILAPSLGRMRMPVIAYMATILTMAWFACERWEQIGQSRALMAAIGAVLFVISDTILAINRFRYRFNLARLLNLTTYFAAQVMIASSVGPLLF